MTTGSGHPRAERERGSGIRFAAILAALAFFTPVPTSAEMRVLEPDQDATLIERPDGTLANGQGFLFVGRTGQSQRSIRRGLLRFDVAAALPAGAWITHAELILSLTRSNQTPSLLGLHRVLTPWTEGPSFSSGGGGAPAQPGDATWLHTSYDTTLWSQPGGDFDPFPSSVTQVETEPIQVWPATPELLDDLQEWLDEPASNHGWLLLGNEATSSTAKRFVSRESEDSLARPRLVITYTLGCDEADLPPGAHGLCHAYCEALDCDGPEPSGSDQACSRLARNFQRRAGGAPLPCAP
jgi:hypothetical protein